MNLTPTALLAHARTEAGRRAIRYSATSLAAVALTQVLLVLFLEGFAWEAKAANFTAVCLVSIPAFLFNKYWVWGKSGRARIRREVIPFWLFTVAGWALSTAAVARASSATTEDTLGHTFAVMSASIAGFGVLWVLKFLFLDKIMFGPHHHTPYDEDIEIEEAEIEAHEIEAHIGEAPAGVGEA